MRFGVLPLQGEGGDADGDSIQNNKTRSVFFLFARAFLTFHEASLSFRTVLGKRQVAFGESVPREPGYSTVM